MERGVREGRAAYEVFPRLQGLGTQVEGTGLDVRVRITRQVGAPPIRLVGPDEPVEAAAIREIDLQRTYKHGPQALADKLNIDTGRAKALRWHLGIEDDPACRHDFVFGKSKHTGYSDAALEKMRSAIAAGVDFDDVRNQYRATTKAKG